MNFRQANTDCRRLCRQWDIPVVRVIPLHFTAPHKYEPPFIARDKNKWLGHWDRVHRCVEVNRRSILMWTGEEIKETIQHELMHALCYQKYPGYSGEHDERYMEVCKEHGLSDCVASAEK
jgi:hypothetical protein